jgi:rhamnosyltransferase
VSAPRVSAIVPTLNGAATLPPLLRALDRARGRYGLEILAIDSGSTDGTLALLRAAGASALDLGGRVFGHASARNRAAAHARGDVLLFLTQDVEPVGDDWLDGLLTALQEPHVAGAFGRQIPRGASREESFLARVNYPETPRVITRDLLGAPFGPGLLFFSNAFGAIRRAIWTEHPFPGIVMSEDQAWGRDVLRAGLQIHYVPQSAVYHGHRLPLGRAFRRNFDSGSALQSLGLVTFGWRSGVAHLAREMEWIAREAGAGAVGHAVVYEAVRILGFQIGRMEPHLPRSVARRLGEAPRESA